MPKLLPRMSGRGATLVQCVASLAPMAYRRPTSQELAQKSAELSDRTEKNRKNMIESELSVVDVFCDRAETELRIGNCDRANDVLNEAKKALDEARRRIDELPSEPHYRKELRDELDGLQDRMECIKKAA